MYRVAKGGVKAAFAKHRITYLKMHDVLYEELPYSPQLKHLDIERITLDHPMISAASSIDSKTQKKGREKDSHEMYN